MSDPKEPASNVEDPLPQSFLLKLLRACEKLDQLYSRSDGAEIEGPPPRPASLPVNMSLYQARYDLLVRSWLEHAVYEHTKGSPNDVKCDMSEDVREKNGSQGTQSSPVRAKGRLQNCETKQNPAERGDNFDGLQISKLEDGESPVIAVENVPTTTEDALDVFDSIMAKPEIAYHVGDVACSNKPSVTRSVKNFTAEVSKRTSGQ